MAPRWARTSRGAATIRQAARRFVTSESFRARTREADRQTWTDQSAVGSRVDVAVSSLSLRIVFALGKVICLYRGVPRRFAMRAIG
jgi:hypothetical protein